MKRALYYSTAAVALIATQSATAQEWDLGVHGYFNQHMGYASNDFDAGNSGIFYDGYRENGDYDEAVFYTDAEIHFTPSIQLDNGLTFGVNIQLEGNNNSPDIDESYMIIKGDRFGKLLLGTTNSAGYKMMVAAPNVTTMPVNSPSISQYVPFSGVYSGGFRQAGTSSFTEVAGNNDMQRITYFTPSFNGFTLGGSYAPQGDTAGNSGAYNNGVFDRKEQLRDVFDIAASYTQSFNNIEISVAGRYGWGKWGKNIKGGRSNPDTWAAGAQFGYSGFTIGGGYAENDNGGAQGVGDSTGWNLGASYDMAGPWSFSATTYQGKTDIGTEKQKYHAYIVGADREIGPGVSFDTYGFYVKANNGYKGTDMHARVKGWGLGTALNLNF